jgi:CHASE2 domain-containing sensor protein
MSHEHIKNAGDVVAGSVALATVAAWLPPLAALASLIYACLRIYEWLEKRRKKRP